MRPRRHLAIVIVALALGASDPAPGAAHAELAAQSVTANAYQTAVEVVRVSTTGFDWGDAAIGAAAGFGLSMLVIGGGLVIAGARWPGQRIAGPPTLEPPRKQGRPEQIGRTRT